MLKFWKYELSLLALLYISFLNTKLSHMKKQSYFTLLYFTLLCCISTTIKAQKIDLFQEISSDMASLTKEENLILDAYKVKKTTNFVKLVRMPTSLSELNNFDVRPLGEEGTLKAIKSTVNANDEDVQASWVGNFDNGRGHMILFSTAIGKFGSLFYDDKSVEIFPIRPDLAVYVQNDSRKNPGLKCAESKDTPTDGVFCEAKNDCTAVIDVLVIIHKAALVVFNPAPNPSGNLNLGYLSQNSFIQLKIKQEITRTNLAFKNSDIPNKTLRLAGIRVLDMPLSPDNLSPLNSFTAIKDDKESLISNSKAIQFRKDTKADLVVMITNQKYLGVTGVTTQFPVAPKNLYTIIEASTIGPDLTFQHEIGHMLGASHTIDVTGPDKDCGHAHYLPNGNSTIVGYTPVRILHYSNPDVKFLGDLTGSPDHNNARKIQNAACLVADYSDKLTSGDFSFIDGKSTICCNCVNAYTAYTTSWISGNGLSYVWEWSIDASFTNPNIISKTTKTISIPNFTKDFFYVRAKMVTPGGLTFQTVKRIDVEQPCFSTNPKTVSNVTLAPNPADDFLDLTYDSAIDDSGRFTILSSSGNVFQTSKLNITRGTNTYNIVLDDIPSGIYYAQFVSSTSSIVLPFVKN